MHRLSLVVSLIALGLMCLGLLSVLAAGRRYSLPGEAVLPLDSVVNLRAESPGMLAVSLGVALLGLLPALRVLLAGAAYLRARRRWSSLVALIVLVELLASIVLGHLP